MPPKPKRSEDEIKADLYKVISELGNPEGIAGDGEYPASKVRATYARLNARRAALYKELGREPDTDFDMQVLDWGDQRNP